MKKKIAYAVFALTDSGKDYMVKGNFGNDKEAAEDWRQFHEKDMGYMTELADGPALPRYPNGLFVKRIEY